MKDCPGPDCPGRDCPGPDSDCPGPGQKPGQKPSQTSGQQSRTPFGGGTAIVYDRWVFQTDRVPDRRGSAYAAKLLLLLWPLLPLLLLLLLRAATATGATAVTAASMTTADTDWLYTGRLPGASWENSITFSQLKIWRSCTSPYDLMLT